MVTKVILNLHVKSESTKEYIKFLEENLPNVRNFEGCQSVELYFNEDLSEMIINETWNSKDAHKKYIEFISSNGVMQELASFLSSEPNIKYYDILDI